jgi:2-dehydro-3-deoxyphosphogluconate aldolase/(4S)-4-hydroxy-2-oxoglutarate aldolase
MAIVWHWGTGESGVKKITNMDRSSFMHETIARFEEMCVIPVVALERDEDATPLADALIEGGLPCAEITFRTAAAARVIEIMCKRGDILVGAGTVLSVEQVKVAWDAGARFMVSPGLNPKVASYCVENKIPFTPGICTPSDIERAMDSGFDVVKFFPAEAFGGVKTLKALSGPYTAVRFIPTGGIYLRNLAEYLQLSNVLACGGTWIADKELLLQKRFDEILKNTRKTREIVQKVRRSEAR